MILRAQFLSMGPHAAPYPSALRALVVLAFAAISFGCTGFHPALTCPKNGGPAWVQVSTPHFDLYTDAGAEAAREHALDMELRYSALAHVLAVPDTALGSKLDVVWFERKVDYWALRGSFLTSNGMFRAGSELDLEPSPVIVESREFQAAIKTLQHELTHRLLRLRTRRLPVWLDEGMADYLSTLSIEDGLITVGTLPPKLLFGNTTRVVKVNGFTIVPVTWAPPLNELLAMERDEFYGHTDGNLERGLANYQAAFRLVHYFKHGPSSRHKEQFEKLWQALVRGTSVAKATAAAFEASSLPELETGYQEYLKSESDPSLDVQTFNVPPAPEASLRPLSDSEVHLLWARLRQLNEVSSELIEHDLAEAIAGAPGAAEPHFRRGVFLLRQKKMAEAGKAFAKATAAKPGEPRYLMGPVMQWITQWKIATAPEGELKNLQGHVERLAKAARSAAQLATAATGYLVLQREEEAFALVLRSVQKDASCWLCNSIYAEMLLDLDRPEEALAAAEQALIFVPEGKSDRRLTQLRAQAMRKLDSRPSAP